MHSIDRPVRLVVLDDRVERSRLTVFFRPLLILPHAVWLVLWSVAAVVAAVAQWAVVVVTAAPAASLHGFLARYTRYAAHVGAYGFLAADRYPGFTGDPGYTVDVEVDPPGRQGRLAAGFRLLLALPALMLTGVLVSGSGDGSSYTDETGTTVSNGGWGSLALLLAVLGWFAVLATGRMPRGMRDLVVYCLGYGVQTLGYVLLLTDRYPNASPRLVLPAPDLPEHPVAVVADADLARSRLTVFFRLLLALPHLVWLTLWSILARLALVAGWLAALVLGRLPVPLHRFLAAFTRYALHVGAFVTLVGGPFPGFVGRAGSYPVDLVLEPPGRLRRWTVLFRLFLAVPAFLIAAALLAALVLVAVFGWFAALATGRMPAGLRDLGLACLRYLAQTGAYTSLLTERYPYAAPALEARPRPEAAAEASWALPEGTAEGGAPA